MKINNQQKLNLQISVMAYPKHLSFRRKPESSIHEFLDPGFRRGDDTLPSQLPLQRDNKKKQHGFTLIELIIVVVLLGIVGAMGASFISEAFKGFFDTDVRMEMYEEGKSALVRMEREIHIALPNAVKTLYNGTETDTCDESTPCNEIKFGIIDETAMAKANIFGQYKEEHPTGQIYITDKADHMLEPGTLISIYNTSWNVFADSSRIYNVDHVNPSNYHMYITPETLPPPETIGPASPYGRYYAVRNEAVRFAVTSGVLSRSTATVSASSALSTTFENTQTLAKNVQPSIDPSKTAPNNKLPYFTYESGTSTRNSVVSIHFAISRNGETVNFHKEVQIRNVP